MADPQHKPNDLPLILLGPDQTLVGAPVYQALHNPSPCCRSFPEPHDGICCRVGQGRSNAEVQASGVMLWVFGAWIVGLALILWMAAALLW